MIPTIILVLLIVTAINMIVMRIVAVIMINPISTFQDPYHYHQYLYHYPNHYGFCNPEANTPQITLNPKPYHHPKPLNPKPYPNPGEPTDLVRGLGLLAWVPKASAPRILNRIKTPPEPSKPKPNTSSFKRRKETEEFDLGRKSTFYHEDLGSKDENCYGS